MSIVDELEALCRDIENGDIFWKESHLFAELAAIERVVEDYRDHLDGNGLEHPDSVRALDAIKGGEG